MPVTFYPEKPIELLERYITHKDGKPLRGEIDIYRKIYEDCLHSGIDWHIWHDLNLPFHSDTYNPYRKERSQIDFLVLSKYGVIVVEVKGGPISYKNQKFYYGRNYEKEMDQNPFKQAEGCKFTLKDNVLNLGPKCLVCHSVALPHHDRPFDHKLVESDLIWSKAYSDNYKNDISLYFEKVYSYWKTKNLKVKRQFPYLKEIGIRQVVKAINPQVSDSNKYYNSDTTAWLNITNIEVLSSLAKNDRIMIEGGPGTGKTTLAKAFIDKNKSKRGLYLSWNNFLMQKVKFELAQRKLQNIDVFTLSTFMMFLNPEINYQNLITFSKEEFSEKLSESLTSAKVSEKFPYYDFIIIDEAQDMFERGLDTVLNDCLGDTINGLSEGNSLVLYDIDQSYDLESGNIRELEELFRAYYSHFQLNENKRSSQNPSIKKIANEIIKEEYEDAMNKKQGIQISKFDAPEKIKSFLVHSVLNEIRNPRSSLKGRDCIILIESNLIPSTPGNPGMEYYLKLKDIEELNNSNLCDSSNVLKYTTPLKYKGLEQQNVFLILNTLTNKNMYEAYVGCTRAISNLHIIYLC